MQNTVSRSSKNSFSYGNKLHLRPCHDASVCIAIIIIVAAHKLTFDLWMKCFCKGMRTDAYLFISSIYCRCIISMWGKSC